ncbi:hypothetical protein DPSP01_013977 [Paraphaeosphaeria sporulosa]
MPRHHGYWHYSTHYSDQNASFHARLPIVPGSSIQWDHETTRELKEGAGVPEHIQFRYLHNHSERTKFNCTIFGARVMYLAMRYANQPAMIKKRPGSWKNQTDGLQYCPKL